MSATLLSDIETLRSDAPAPEAPARHLSSGEHALTGDEKAGAAAIAAVALLVAASCLASGEPSLAGFFAALGAASFAIACILHLATRD
ncbi:MAG TPA: hypothetical protein VFR81_16940 [Longimicrobium sp.]|nr:hypothetical protein [Longimicrobium sp.]